MHSIIYLVGLIVVVMFLLSAVGFRYRPGSRSATNFGARLNDLKDVQACFAVSSCG